MTPADASSSGATPLSPERWAQLRALVDEALTLSGEARHAFIDASSGGDEALRARIARLVTDCERADDSWGFLAQPAGALAAPLLVGMPPFGDGFAVDAETPLRRGRAGMAEMLERLRTALADRYRVERELASGGMATVYLARDVRHERNVAIKVLLPELSAMLGAERFLSEIRTTAALHHPNILPLFDSGSADGLLFYVMPLVEGETLRARIDREKQLPVADALRIVSEVAGALEYAHRHGVIHRDIKPENILLHEGRPLVADFGIALAVQSAGAQRLTRTGLSLGTPPYMSPEQASGSVAIDGRSDVYSLACVLFELLIGDPPFTGSTPQVVIARVLAEIPMYVRTVRPSVPPHVEAALQRALAKLPADRHSSAREFADALDAAAASVPAGVSATESASVPAATPVVERVGTRSRSFGSRLAVGAAAIVGLAAATWLIVRKAEPPADIVVIPFPNLVDQAVFSAVTFTPNGRALLYTGTSEAGRPIMLLPLDQLSARPLRGTQGGGGPHVAPDGATLLFQSPGIGRTTISMDGVVATKGAGGWRYGNGAWDGANVVTEDAATRGQVRRSTATGAVVALSKPDTARGEVSHEAPLVLGDRRVVVFTVNRHGGRGALAGPLAIASLDPGASLRRHVLLGVDARRAVAYVDGWLLFISVDGLAIMAVRLDINHERTVGNPIAVQAVPAGDLQTAALADNGSLLYFRRPNTSFPVLVDTTGAVRATLTGVTGPIMNPRLSPDGARVAMQSDANGGHDVWLYDIATRTPRRLTSTGSAIHPTWTPDGRRVVFVTPPQGLQSLPADGSAPAESVLGSRRALGPTVAPDGKAIVFPRVSPTVGYELWSASIDGGDAPRKLIDDQLAHNMPTLSPDGHWLADVTIARGQRDVYVRPYPGPGSAVQISDGGGTEPAWSPDGTRIYYRANGAFMAAGLTKPALAVAWRRQLFKDTFDGAMPHRNYDVAPDGSGFLMITGGKSEAVVMLNWLPNVSARLARER
ncbi:MAG: protein kinase [Gemmatimonadaceae bacterium]